MIFQCIAIMDTLSCFEPEWASSVLNWRNPPLHYSDVIMSPMASQITSLTIVYSTVYSDQGKRQSTASLAFVRWIHQWPVNSPHKGPVTRECFHWWRHHEQHGTSVTNRDQNNSHCRSWWRHFKLIQTFKHRISRLWDFASSYDKTSCAILNQLPDPILLKLVRRLSSSAVGAHANF